MAKRKTIVEDDMQTVELPVDETEVSSTEYVTSSETNVGEQTVEIPAYVSKLLACYPAYPELYVDKLGGVFPKDTQQNLVEGAILYKNPYYNK